VSAKSDRQAASEAVVKYHENQLASLQEHVGAALECFRNGELDAFEVDQVLFQYSRAAKELWKFCNFGDPEFATDLVRERPIVDWWERGAPRQR